MTKWKNLIGSRSHDSTKLINIILITNNTMQLICPFPAFIYIIIQGRRQRGGRGGRWPPQYSSRGASPPPKNRSYDDGISVLTLLLLHALVAFQNALYTTTCIYVRADYSSSSSPTSLFFFCFFVFFTKKIYIYITDIQ